MRDERPGPPTAVASATYDAANELNNWNGSALPTMPMAARPGMAAKWMRCYALKEPKLPTVQNYPGRGRVVWVLGPNSRIVYEAHPYDPAGTFIPGHSDPHWHLDSPGKPHQRFCRGDRIPGK